MPKTHIASQVMPVNVNGTIQNVEVWFKDADARELIENLGHAVYWIGVTTTVLTDGATTNPITVNSESVEARLGGMASYDGSEFVWNGTAWQELGQNNFGALAFKSSATGTYTPAGSVTISKGADTTQSVTPFGAAGELAYFTVDSETATFHPGTLASGGTAVSVITERGTDTASFSGTQATITVS